MSDISLSQLLEAGVHFGHKAYRWNPKMFPYIYSEVNNIHILDLVQSATLLKEANKYLESTHRIWLSNKRNIVGKRHVHSLLSSTLR